MVEDDDAEDSELMAPVIGLTKLKNETALGQTQVDGACGEYLSRPAASASGPSMSLIRSYWLLRSFTASDIPSTLSISCIPTCSWRMFRVICGRCNDVAPPFEPVVERD